MSIGICMCHLLSPCGWVVGRSLEMRLEKLLGQLEECLIPRLDVLLLPAQQGGDEGSRLQPSQRRALGHLLRALAAVRRGEVAEKLVADKALGPLLRYSASVHICTDSYTDACHVLSCADATLVGVCRLHLSQGRVDGAEGRGSYSGLGDSLQALLSAVKDTLGDAVQVCEETFSRGHLHVPGVLSTDPSPSPLPPAVDLLIGGIMQPVLTSLTRSFPGMFSSGIANVFHRSFCAVEDFLSGLCLLGGPLRREALYNRVKHHPAVVSFRQSWKLDLHYQVHASILLTSFHC